MTTYGPDVPTVNLPLVFVYLYGHPFYAACMTIGLIAKSMLELKHVIVSRAHRRIQRFIPCYEMKSSGLNVGLTWGSPFWSSLNLPEIKKMTTINKRLLIARTEHFSIISINTAKRFDEQYVKTCNAI